MKRKGIWLVTAVVFGLLLMVGNLPAVGLETSEAHATEMGKPVMYEKYMTVTTDDGLKVWGDFKGSDWTQKNTAKNLYQKTYWANAYYVHPTTKVKYYSLFEKGKGGTWMGYITQKAVTAAANAGGVGFADGRQFTVAKSGAPLYANLGTLAKSGTTTTLLGQVVTSKTKYNHANGKTYLALVNQAGASLGMVEGTAALKTKQALTVNYQTHVQSYGWQAWQSNGTTSGTTGKSKRLEGIQIKLDHMPVAGGIEYRTHIQGIGWEPSYKKNGAMSGTSGQSKRLEAIQIRLTGEMAEQYDVYYRVHAQQFGWLGWAKNDAPSGTAGFSYRLEGIQIKLVKKDGAAPGSTASPFKQGYKVTIKHQSENGKTLKTETKTVLAGTSYTAESKSFSGYHLSGSTSQTVTVNAAKTITFKYLVNAPDVRYTSHVQKIGWQSTVKNGATSGTTGKSLRIEALKVSLGSSKLSGSIETRAHVQGIGWQDYVKAGAISGTSGQSKRVEAIQVRLTGEIAQYYDVYYRVHAQQFGWLGWGSNGSSAGTQGYSYRVESLQIRLVHKGQAAPGSTSNSFKVKPKMYQVTVVHQGSDGKTLATDKPVSVQQGKTYTAQAKSFSGYTLKGAASQTVTVNGNQTITFNYTKNPAPVQKFAVTVVHNGSDGKTLQTEKAVQVEKGKQFTAKAKTFDGYTLKGATSQTITVNANTTITFNYTKDATPSEPTIAEAEAKVTQDLFNAINNYRQENGLATLGQHDIAMQASATRAIEIFTVFDHVRPDGTLYSTALKELGFSGISGENIGMMTGSDLTTIMQTGYQNAIQAWKDSPDHNSYMLATGVKKMGIGVHIEQTNGYYKIGFVMIGISYDFNEPASTTETNFSLIQETTTSEVSEQTNDQTVDSTITEISEPTVFSEQPVQPTPEVSEPIVEQTTESTTETTEQTTIEQTTETTDSSESEELAD